VTVSLLFCARFFVTVSLLFCARIFPPVVRTPQKVSSSGYPCHANTRFRFLRLRARLPRPARTTASPPSPPRRPLLPPKGTLHTHTKQTPNHSHPPPTKCTHTHVPRTPPTVAPHPWASPTSHTPFSRPCPLSSLLPPAQETRPP
jgi:hypothetical protein